jgi:nucleoside-diphosphate-sugar epimerase
MLVENMTAEQKFVYMSTQYIELLEKRVLTKYKAAKLEGEQITESYATNRNIEYRIIRPGFIYGRWDYHHLPLFKMINRLGMMFPLVGNGRNIVRPTYINDVINLTVNAFNYDEKILRVCGEYMTMKQFLSTLATALGKHPPLYCIPAIHIEPLKTMLKTEFFTSNQPHFRSVIDPTSLERGLNECIWWYKSA